MKTTLKSGIGHEKRFVVPLEKTVPHLYPESAEFRAMPEVFATGYFIGLIEWTCIEAVNPHLEWPEEQTLGIHVDVSHEAATPPGLEVAVKVELTEVEGRKLVFKVETFDEAGVVGRGRHERFVIDRERFDSRMADKLAR